MCNTVDVRYEHVRIHRSGDALRCLSICVVVVGGDIGHRFGSKEGLNMRKKGHGLYELKRTKLRKYY